MDKVKHTSGPFEIRPDDPREVRAAFKGSGGDVKSYVIAQFFRADAPHSAEANARLFAAAPDLLAVCYLAINQLGQDSKYTTLCFSLRDAIAKAMGAK